MILIIILLIIFLYLHIVKDRNYNKKVDVYLVSLDKDIERRNNILSKINVDYIYSVDGSKLNGNSLEIKNTNLKKGEIGCYMSHVHLLNKVLENKNKITLILEDDAEIEKDTFQKIENIIKYAPEDFEIIFLGYNYYENYDYERVSNVYGAHGYIIKNDNITKDRIGKLFPITYPIDVALANVFKSYIIKPKAIELNKTYSKISNTQSIN